MNILVTGGAGFLGRHLIARLIQQNHNVRILDITEPALDDGALTYISGSFTEHEKVAAALKDCHLVYHLASSVIPKTSNDSPIADVQTNLIGTLNLLNCCVDSGVKRIIYPSSGGTIYGETNDEVVKEWHPTHPISSYGIVKLTVEKYFYLFNRLHGLESVVLRISNLYGEYQRHDTGLGLIAAVCYKALNDEVIEIWGDGSVSRDFVYVGDVVDAMLVAMSRGDGCTIVNIGSGQCVTLNEILETVEELIGKNVRRKYLAERPFDVKRICLDISAANEKLDWRPKTSLKSGIKKVLHVLEK